MKIVQRLKEIRRRTEILSEVNENAQGFKGYGADTN